MPRRAVAAPPAARGARARSRERADGVAAAGGDGSDAPEEVAAEGGDGSDAPEEVSAGAARAAAKERLRAERSGAAAPA